MNIAILLGVSQYQKLEPLPACSADVRLIEALVADQFSDYLKLDPNLPSTKLKNELATYITKHKGTHIEQALFYFSGHGDADQDNFYYLLGDFDEKRKQQTALSNEELDALLRSLGADVTIKIVDACRAGQRYIKDPAALEKYIKGTQPSFKNCYFLFSSQVSQASFADNRCSDFTRAIGDAIVQQPDAVSVRYRDIMSSLADAFSGNAQQTPLFVTQADYTDVFCVATQPIKDAVRALLLASASADIAKQQDSGPSTPLDVVRDLSKSYLPQEAVLAWLDDLLKEVRSFVLLPDLSSAFDLSITVDTTLDAIPSASAIGKWLHDSPGEFFAKPEYTSGYEEL